MQNVINLYLHFILNLYKKTFTGTLSDFKNSSENF